MKPPFTPGFTYRTSFAIAGLTVPLPPGAYLTVWESWQDIQRPHPTSGFPAIVALVAFQAEPPIVMDRMFSRAFWIEFAMDGSNWRSPSEPEMTGYLYGHAGNYKPRDPAANSIAHLLPNFRRQAGEPPTSTS